MVARQSILSLKAAMRKMTLDENEIEEKIRAQAGLVDIEELTKDEAEMAEGQDDEPVIGEVAS